MEKIKKLNAISTAAGWRKKPFKVFNLDSAPMRELLETFISDLVSVTKTFSFQISDSFSYGYSNRAP